MSRAEPICRNCGTTKRHDGKRLVCDPCNRGRSNAWQNANPKRAKERGDRWRSFNRERINAAARARVAANPEKYREQSRRNKAKPEYKIRQRWSWIFKNYGLTREQWELMFEAQGRCCAVCKGVEPGTKHGWHTDHKHGTNIVRGILCHGCNVMLGGAKDRTGTLRAGAGYLELYENPTTDP